MSDNTFYLLVSSKWLDLLALGTIGLALGLARGAYGGVNGNVGQRMLRFGLLGFCGASLWTLAIVVDKGSDDLGGVIPFGPVMNLVILIVISIWAQEILKSIIGAADRVTGFIQNKIIDRLTINGGRK